MSEAAAEYRTTEAYREQFQLATDIHQICLLKIVETYRQREHCGFDATDVDKIITELEQEIIQEVMDWTKRPWWEALQTLEYEDDDAPVETTDIDPGPYAMSEAEYDRIFANFWPRAQEPSQEDEPPAEDAAAEEPPPPPPPPITAPKAPPARKPTSHKDGGKATKSAATVLRLRIQALLDEGCSITRLAETAKLSDPTVRNIIAGGTPRAATYDKLADALDRLGA